MKLFSGHPRRSRLVRWAAAIAVTLFAAAAFAAPPDDPNKGKEFNFETDEVTVDLLKPDLTSVEVLRAQARRSLIRIRMDFVKEIVRSAEDI